MIDGGKGQLNAALAAFRDQEIEPPFMVSLAKREEEIYLPGDREPIRLGRESFALRLLQYVRDEAHRFAQHYHHLLREKSLLGETASKVRKKRAIARLEDAREAEKRPSGDEGADR